MRGAVQDERPGGWKSMPDGLAKTRAFLDEVHRAERRVAAEPSAAGPSRALAALAIALGLAVAALVFLT